MPLKPLAAALGLLALMSAVAPASAQYFDRGFYGGFGPYPRPTSTRAAGRSTRTRGSTCIN